MYEPQAGIVSGAFAGSVIHAGGRLARLHVDHGDGNYETVHVAHQPDGTWMDLDYGIGVVTDVPKP